jgi:hypothetical protein
MERGDETPCEGVQTWDIRSKIFTLYCMFKRKGSTDQEQIQLAKEKFVQTITNKDALQEFKEVLSMTKYANLAQTLFSFMENYWSFQDLFGNANFQPSPDFNPRLIPRNHPLIVHFLNDVVQRPKSSAREIPDTLVHQLYRFYATFIAAGAPIEVPFVSNEMREEVALQLLLLSTKPKICSDIFDPIADIALEALFSKCYPKYCTAKGINMPIMKSVQQQYRDWEQFIATEHSETQSLSSQESGSSKKKPKESIWKSMFKKGEFELKATRECMIHVIQTPKLYSEFSQFVKVFIF